MHGFKCIYNAPRVEVVACLFVSVLTIIELQNNMWDLETKAANDTTGDYVKG